MNPLFYLFPMLAIGPVVLEVVYFLRQLISPRYPTSRILHLSSVIDIPPHIYYPRVSP